MSLITRCPACGTMFKVVADQLKIAQGWVRCGQCAEVFDASAQLLPAEVGGAVTSSLVEQEPPMPELAGDIDRAELAGNSEEVEEAQTLSDILPEPNHQEVPSLPDNAPLPSGRLALEDATQGGADVDFDPVGWRQALLKRQQQELVLPLIGVSAPAVQLASPEQFPKAKSAGETDSQAPDLASIPVQDADQGGIEAVQEVSFVRDARRRAFWKKPLVRGVLIGLFLSLFVMLALQWTVLQKDRLAALEPRLMPVLQALCRPLHCEIQPPRQIESLIIDSSTFNKMTTDTYRLGFMLKNTGGTILEVPSLELTLTDTQDQAVVRRVLAPAQYGANATTVAAHSELAGAVTLKVSGDAERAGAPLLSSSAPRASLRVAGYRILAFYP